MLQLNTEMANQKFRLLKILILQIWTVCEAINDQLPMILEMPQDFIFAPTRYDPVTFQAILSPYDVRLLLLVRYSHQSKYGFHILYNSSKDLSGTSSSAMEPLMVTTSFNIDKDANQLSFNITLSNWIRLISQPIHLQVSSSFGSIISNPIKILLYYLSNFEEKGDEYVEFVMGNVGQVLCEVPSAKPSPPIVRFQHNSAIINVTNASRYVVIEFPPMFDRVALLISNIMLEDSGIYKCVSYLKNTNYVHVSDKKTHLIVKVPKHNIPTRFRLSSHSTLDDSNKIDVKVSEGSQLVLYCIYESAPILEVNWYWPRNDRHYKINQHFGMLTISNVSVRDNSDVSCIINEANGKIFQIHVYQLPEIAITPALVTVNHHTLNSTLTLRCQGNLQEIQGQTIHWLFNGEMANVVSNIFVKEFVLTIQRLSEKNIGVYQCLVEFNNQWLSATGVIQLTQRKLEQSVIKSQKVIQIKPGASVSLLCQNPIEYPMDSTLVKWYRKRGNKLLLARDGKYDMHLLEEQNQYVLAIRHTREGQDNDTYTCKIYSNKTWMLLVESNFQLVFNKSTQQNQSPSNNSSIQATPMFQITVPIVVLPKMFLVAVNITWQLFTNILISNLSNPISHYKIEVREGTRKYLPVRWRTSEPTIQWNKSITIKTLSVQSSFIIHNPQILKPQLWYSFRVLGILNTKNLQTQLYSSSKNILNYLFQEAQSNWSDPINFEHIIPRKPNIVSVTLLNSSTATLKWSYSPLANLTNDHKTPSIEFKIIYITLPSMLITEDRKNNLDKWRKLLYDSQLRSDDQYSDNIRIVRKISSATSSFHYMELNNLKPNTYYMITLYCIIRPIYGGAKKYSMLSDAFFLNTSLVEEKLATINEGFETTFHNDTASSPRFYQYTILFLILVSLAGILFIIAITMFTLCLWYQVMYHNRKRDIKLSCCPSAKTSSANPFTHTDSTNHVVNNSVFVTSSHTISPQNLSLWHNNINREPSEFSHLYVAQHFSLWSPNHLAQFNLPSSAHDTVIDENKSRIAADSPTTLSTPSQRSNLDLEVNNLDGSMEDSQEESVRLLEDQPDSDIFKREPQCTMNNAFSVQSEGRDRRDLESLSDYGRSISHYPFSPSALNIYSQKKRPKFCSTNRKDSATTTINLTSKKTDLPILYSPNSSIFSKESSTNHYNRLRKDNTFEEHPFPSAVDHMSKNYLTTHRESSSKPTENYSSMKTSNTQKLSSKFLFDPIIDLNILEDSTPSTRHFSFSMYPDHLKHAGVNMELSENNQTNF